MQQEKIQSDYRVAKMCTNVIIFIMNNSNNDLRRTTRKTIINVSSFLRFYRHLLV